MFEFIQGDAPSIYFEEGKQVWYFKRGTLKTDDEELADKLIAAGAVIVSGDVEDDDDDDELILPFDHVEFTRQEIADWMEENEGVKIPMAAKGDMVAKCVKYFDGKDTE